MKMKNEYRTAARVAAIALALAPGWLPVAALAGDGHDHGDAPAAVEGPALPRFAAESADFELVGVVDGKRLTLYLDRFADGSPVTGATVELELGDARHVAEAEAGGTFEVMLPKALAPGEYPVAATIRVDGRSDRLVADLDIHDEAHAAAVEHGPASTPAAVWGGLALAGLLAARAVRRLRGGRRLQTGGAA